MKLKICLLSFLFFTFIFSFLSFSTKSAFADTFTLSGKVSDSSNNAISGVTISVNDTNSDHTTTNSSGNYTISSIPGGAYNIQVTPPSGSGFTSVIAINQNISANTILNFILVPIGTVTLSGHVYGSQGGALPNQIVKLVLPNTNSLVATATTDSLGAYSLQASPGTYDIIIRTNSANSSFLNAPQEYQLTVPSYSLTQSTILDFTLPTYQVTLHVQDASGTAVSGVSIGIPQGSGGNLNLGSGITNAAGFSHYGDSYAKPQTDSSGNLIMWLFSNASGAAYTFTATPPSGSIYNIFTLSNISITTDPVQNEIISLQFIHPTPVTTATLTSRYSDETYTDPTTVTLSATAASGFTIAHTYYTIDGGAKQTYSSPFTVSGSGNHSITYWSVDNLGVSETPNTKTFFIDDPPKISPIPGGTINEGDTYTQTGSFTDTDSTSWTGTVDYGDGQGAQPLTINPGKTFTLSHKYLDNKPNNAPYTVTVNITDNQGAGSTVTTSVVVNNVPPNVSPITVSQNPVVLGNPFFVNSTSFFDPGVLDTHTAVWDWGDGQTSQGTVIETNGSGVVSATDHTYTLAGLYTITLRVTDNDGATETSTFQYATVFQPTHSGLFSGHSQFTSPLGADIANPTITGNVHFDIQVKYANGTNVPTGTTQMDFSKGTLSFSATSFDSLIVNGTQGTIQGSGTLNGANGYTFLASGIDGTQTGTGYIRFQIKNPTGTIIYDTQPGQGGSVAPTTPVTGMVVVHK